ncbi:MAG: GPW/gp25 family protein, partial [Pseudomonadota bacterium]|nr:GPW/gp25 family protein [Pseudomonadota bacterium]
METAVRKAIATFEPRLDATTLSVKIEIDSRRHHNTLQLTVRADMWAQPVPLELLLAADVDLETGNTRMRDAR